MPYISKNKKLMIANVCYANVSGLFADMHNPVMQGPNFKWIEFPSICDRWYDTWMFTSNLGNSKELLEIAKQYTKEISTRLCTGAGYIKE